MIEQSKERIAFTSAGAVSFNVWQKEVQALCYPDFDAMAKLYSFRSAYDEGLTARQAYRDCKNWLEA
jgi:hypothetical protein